jgi:hypothetical protein
MNSWVKQTGTGPLVVIRLPARAHQDPDSLSRREPLERGPTSGSPAVNSKTHGPHQRYLPFKQEVGGESIGPWYRPSPSQSVQRQKCGGNPKFLSLLVSPRRHSPVRIPCNRSGKRSLAGEPIPKYRRYYRLIIHLPSFCSDDSRRPNSVGIFTTRNGRRNMKILMVLTSHDTLGNTGRKPASGLKN